MGHEQKSAKTFDSYLHPATLRSFLEFFPRKSETSPIRWVFPWALGKVWIDFKFLRLEVAVSRLKIAAIPLWRLCILLAT